MDKFIKIVIGFFLISNFAFAQNDRIETVFAIESDTSDYSYVEHDNQPLLSHKTMILYTIKKL